MKESIALNFNVHIDFLSCYRMISGLKKYVSNHAATLENIERPYYHNHIKLLCKSMKGSKDFHDLLKTDKASRDLRCLYKWETDLNISLDLNSWKNIHKICFFSIKENSLIWFQYKIIYRLIGVKHYLYKINLSTSPTCGLCHENEETLYHLFVSYEKSSRFWDNIKVWIKQVLKVEIVLSPSTVILGNWELETPNYLVNILSIAAKYYIFQCSRKHIKLNISGFLRFVNNMYNEQKYLSKIEMPTEIFMKKWSVFTILFNDFCNSLFLKQLHNQLQITCIE